MLVGGSCGCFMGSFWPGFNPFGAVGGGGGGGGLCAVSGVESLVCVLRLPGLILLGGFSGTLLVVSILHMGYDCYL